jgi:hypothetical protein
MPRSKITVPLLWFVSKLSVILDNFIRAMTTVKLKNKSKIIHFHDFHWSFNQPITNQNKI